jgi:hypothetical protein
MYMIKCDGGYRVVNHPKGKERRFKSKANGEAKNYELALEYLSELNKL